jgi:peroxiredoxin Q/BCP
MKLTEGKKAPAIKLKDQDGNSINLSDFSGQKVVIYFYPKDDTPTCTVQACNLRDNFSVLQKNGIVVIGISPDEEESHKKFAGKHKLPFILLADPKHTVLEKYGVWGEKSMYGRKYMGVIRTTFLIDEKGVLRKIIEKPKSSEHAKEIMNEWKKIAVAEKK